VVLLSPDGDGDPLIGIPLSLPMGWSHSPPYFCTFTETGADIINHGLVTASAPSATPCAIPSAIPNTSHPLLPRTTPPQITMAFDPTNLLPWQPQRPSTPLALADVYIDDPTTNSQCYHGFGPEHDQ
jgi:hypothetical protein